MSYSITKIHISGYFAVQGNKHSLTSLTLAVFVFFPSGLLSSFFRGVGDGVGGGNLLQSACHFVAIANKQTNKNRVLR